MSTILDKIVNKRKEYLVSQKSKISFNELTRECRDPKPFFRQDGDTLIAECKKGSPSRGIFCEEYNPVAIAQAYEQGGATSLSVLTEPDFFWGSDEHLIAVRDSVSLPIIRKDFMVDPYQIKESWAIGADCVLLIGAVLSQSQLQELAAVAHEHNLEVLLEVHDEQELETALQVDHITAIGVNARNLKDFSIDLEMTKELCKKIPDAYKAVAESGLKHPTAGKEMKDAGFNAFLVGEYFVTAQNRADTVKEFASHLDIR